MLDAADHLLPVQRRKTRCKPFWNELVELARQTALFWHAIWCQSEKPVTGIVSDIRKRTRSEYHKIIRESYKKEESLHRTQMVNSIRQDKARNLFKEVNKLKHKHNSTPSSMDNIVEPREVAQLFKNKFEMIYSSNPSTNDELRQIENTVNSRIKLCHQDQVSVVTVQNVKDAVSGLKTRKI